LPIGVVTESEHADGTKVFNRGEENLQKALSTCSEFILCHIAMHILSSKRHLQCMQFEHTRTASSASRGMLIGSLPELQTGAHQQEERKTVCTWIELDA
jgi:hypothetical protein